MQALGLNMLKTDTTMKGKTEDQLDMVQTLWG